MTSNTDSAGGALDLGMAMDALARGDVAHADKLARHALTSQSSNPDWLAVAAQVAATKGELQSAIDILSVIPREDPQYGLMSLGMTAQWEAELGNYSAAIEHYRQILKSDPSAVFVHRRLAVLLRQMGLIQDAGQEHQQLCRAGDVQRQELGDLIHWQSGLPLAPHTTLARARAQWLSGQHKAAIQTLVADEKSAKSMLTSGSHWALLGRIAVEAHDREYIASWWQQGPEDQHRYSDYWVALAMLASEQHHPPQWTAGLLVEALRRDNTDWMVCGLLENCMDQLGDRMSQANFKKRANNLKRSIQISQRLAGQDTLSAAEIEPLARTLDDLNRPLEATLWRMLGLAGDSANPSSGSDESATLQRTFQDLQASPHAFSNGESFKPDSLPKLNADQLRHKAQNLLSRAAPWLSSQLGEKRDEEKTDSVDSTGTSFDSTNPDATRIRFSELNESIGLNFRYANAAPSRQRDFMIYQQFGGGVACVDYDLDGCIDLYFPQAAGEPLAGNGAEPNRMFRQLDHAWIDVTRQTDVDDRSYSLGASCGDVNQDGFDDLFVCNFGRNTLLINQGDGTFRRSITITGVAEPIWTASAAIADLNLDGLPEIVEANYLDDEAVFNLPAEVVPGRHYPTMGPESFDAAFDRILVQQPNGTWTSQPLFDGLPSPGLGILVANIDNRDGPEIYIANDTQPNQLWRRPASAANDLSEFKNVAKQLGCAYSAVGGSGASMGIAAGDLDHNGRLDLHVTNFFNEPVHCYLQDPTGVFRDFVAGSQLYHPSMRVLGFGTSAIDLENDGDLDLAVVNGHIEDLQYLGSPFKMMPQLFRNQNAIFHVVSPEAPEGTDLPAFFSTPSLGRGLVRLDWNRDGRADLVATSLDANVVLLENRTTSSHSWLQLELVGVTCERGAIGAVVSIATDRGLWTEWKSSGDGYSCRHDPTLLFGLGNSTEIEHVEVLWPTGERETFDSIPLNQRVLLIQGQTLAFETN